MALPPPSPSGKRVTPLLLLALALGAAVGGRRCVHAQLVPRGEAPLEPNADCDIFSQLWGKVQELDAECPGAPERCTVPCGVALLPFWDACGSMLNALSLFDDADGSHDGRAGMFAALRGKCNDIPSADLLDELKPLYDAGQCPADWMEDVSTTAVPAEACQDVRTGCEPGIASGFMSCERDFCPTCGLAGQCDKTCGLCSNDAETHGHRLQIATAEHECPPHAFETEAAAVNEACCDEGGCAGVPTECDARCGVVYIDFYSRCSDLLGIYHVDDMVGYTRLQQTCAEQMPAEPLLRLIGRCTSHDTTMASCQAKLAQGITSCFIYLQADAVALGAMAVQAGQTIETHGLRDTMLQVQADWEVGAASSLLLADVQLVGGSGGAAQLNIQADGALTLQHAQMDGGAIASSGFVSVLDSILTNAQMMNTASTAALTLSGGTTTGSALNIESGTAACSSCELINSPVTVSGTQEPGSLSLSQCHLQNDGSSVPLTVQAGGSATVRASEFQSAADDDITAVSVDAGGSVIVGQSQLVHADGRADPFPCNGTLPTCVELHAGPVEVIGPAVITLASPLVCDVLTGQCLSDLCIAFAVDCGAHGSCSGGTCICVDGYSGDVCEVAPLPCCSST
jgi:hypothetical protein